MKQKKFLLPESEIPTHYFNMQAVMPNKPLPILNPATKEPLKVEDLYPIFCEECAKQELNQTDEWIPIPEPVREQYAMYRCTPLVQLNSALAQAYYAKAQGITNITTETGAGQWGGALSYAAKKFGLELAVYMVKLSYEQKPYRRSIMQTFGAAITPSPSMSTRAGKDILTINPNDRGSLGCAISEAIELAVTTPNCRYTLGSVLNHVCLHQSIIGLEAEKQMAIAGEYPDIVIACFGGGSNFSGIAYPFMRHNMRGERKTRFIAAEPASCPKLTRGKFEYDFGDEAGLTPLLPMYTIGHGFKPASIHAGGLRYHGAGVIMSQLMKDGYMEAVDINQLDSFNAGVIFARTEGIIPAPESCHAIAATIQEALKCKETGEAKTILFNLSGHGFVDMGAYDQYFSGEMQNYQLSDEELARFIKPDDELNSSIR